MSRRSWLRVMEDFDGHDGYMAHARTIPVDDNGEVLEMAGDLDQMNSFYFGSKYKVNTKLTEKQQRQQLTTFVHFHSHEKQHFDTVKSLKLLIPTAPSSKPIEKIAAKSGLMSMDSQSDEGDLYSDDSPICSDHDSEEYSFKRKIKHSPLKPLKKSSQSYDNDFDTLVNNNTVSSNHNEFKQNIENNTTETRANTPKD